MFKSLFSLFTFILLLLGCKPEAPTTKTPTLQCLAKQMPCQLKSNEGNFTFTFDVNEVRTEVPFTFYVTYKGQETIKKITGYLEGKNMFMGKLPLFFTKTTLANHQLEQTIIKTLQVYSAKSMVVACSEPNMQWNLWLTVAIESSAKQVVNKSILINFSSRY